MGSSRISTACSPQICEVTMLIILNFISIIWFYISNRYGSVFHTLGNGNCTVCMHINNLIRITFMLRVFSFHTLFYAENFFSYHILMGDTLCIFSRIIACNLSAFVFSHQLPVDHLLHVKQHVPTEHNLCRCSL